MTSLFEDRSNMRTSTLLPYALSKSTVIETIFVYKASASLGTEASSGLIGSRFELSVETRRSFPLDCTSAGLLSLQIWNILGSRPTISNRVGGPVVRFMPQTIGEKKA